MVNVAQYQSVINGFINKNVQLVAVSKLQPKESIILLYQNSQKDFGENYVQELLEKQQQLPADIRWHFIGHLQSNKVKYIAPFIYLIQGVDSEKLLTEINKQALKHNRKINCLLQVHIAEEETKFGFSPAEVKVLLHKIIDNPSLYSNIIIYGLMGMASLTDDTAKIRGEFRALAGMFHQFKKIFPSFNTLSMGMTADYEMAIEEGSNMVRIGSLLFGQRKS